MQFDVMRFPSYAFDPQTGVATFDYLLDGPEPLSFTETITFPVAERPVPAAFHRVLDLLHVVAGVSYYKVGAPARVVAPTAVPAAAAEFFTAVYTDGLAEYAYRNRLAHVLDLTVEVPGQSEPARRAGGGGGPEPVLPGPFALPVVPQDR